MQVSSEPGTETDPSLSPDGNWVAYAASGEIYLRRVGTEGVEPSVAGRIPISSLRVTADAR